MTSAAPPSLWLEELTWPEAAEAIAAGYTTVVAPCGAVEQHGPHVAMLSDTLQARALALRLAERLGNTLIAPVIPVGCSEHHMGFAGTVSIRPETLEAIYADYCRSLTRHGFQRVACISGHGGNFAPLANMLPRLREVAAPAQVAAYTDVMAYLGAISAAVAAAGADASKVGGHADLAESSAVLALRPDLVRVDRAEPGFMGGIEAAAKVIFRDGMRSVTENGVLGDPRGLEPALGRQCLEAMTGALVDYFRTPSVWKP